MSFSRRARSGGAGPARTEVAIDSTAPLPVVDPVAGGGSVDGERSELVQLCLYALDRARSQAVATHIERGLATAGVLATRPDGERFDPAHHEAGGTRETDDPALDGRVAETEHPGFTDRGRLLRVPVVTVYQLRP